MAGGAREVAVAGRHGRPGRRHARPLVPRRGLHAHVGGARRRRRAVRGRLRGLRAAARRARPAGGGRGVAPPEPHAQGARVAAAGCAGPNVQAEVPHRRGERAHRAGAAGARPHRARSSSPPRASARTSSTCSTCRCRSATTRCCATSSGASGRGSGPASSASTAPARAPCSGWSPAPCKPTSGRVKRGKTVQVGTLSQTLAELEPFADDRVSDVVAKQRTSFVAAGQELSPGQLLERLGLLAGRSSPHRCATCPAARSVACSCWSCCSPSPTC